MASVPEVQAARGRSRADLGQVERNFRGIAEAHPENADVIFVLGLMAYRDGRYEPAVDYIRQAVALDATNPDYAFYLAAAQHRLGRLDEAEAGYRRALQLAPHQAEAHHGLGTILAARGRPEDGVACCARALQARPDFAAAHASQAAMLERLGRLDEALEAYRRAAQLDPADAGPLKGLGILYARRGKLAEAAAAYQQALRLLPDDADAHNELGIVYARQGALPEAEASYRAALRARPDLPDAHNNLGNVLRNTGRLDDAIAHYEEALRLRPAYAECHNNLGIALKRKGKYDEAVACYQRALQLKPNYPDAHNNLGIALAERGKLDGALVCFHQAIRLRPDYLEAHANLANALSDQNRLDEAVAAYRRALELRPGDAYLHKNLGIALSRMDRLQEAEACFREALRRAPDFAEAYNDLGITLSRQGRYDEAIATYNEALRRRPQYPEVLNNLGNALRNAGRFDDSVECYRRAIRLRPDYADAHNNLGITLAELGRFDEAVASYTECLRLRPTHVDAHLNRALTWLRQGDFAQGWAEYEWRWRKRQLAPRSLVQPQWNGSDPAGRRVLLVTEQGLGDTIQFVRYARSLKARGATVILECPEALVQLLAQVPEIDRIVTQKEAPPDHDVFCPLLSLPGLMGSSPESFPAEVPYLHADPALVERWRRELAGIPGLKVGINWQGNPGYAGDRHRSIPLAAFEPLARVPGVTLISLQKNHGAEQLGRLAGRFPVVELGSRLDVQTGPFLDTAAVLKNLDLLVTCDTSVGHLAGALGVRTWLALSSTPDWRWLTDREDTWWYPTMRLFRQSEYLNWGPVFARMADALAALARGTAPPRPASPPIAMGELLDRLTTLEIKAERLSDPGELRAAHRELEALRQACPTAGVAPAPLAELRNANEALWQVEAEIRACERAGDFGPRFVELARSVYRINDVRAAAKRRIDELHGAGSMRAGSP